METVARKKPRPRRSFTPEFKADIVERCRRGDRTVAQVARDFDLIETAVRESSGDLWISFEVTAAQALDVASVIDGGDFVLVRSTGATDDATAAPSPPAATSADGPSPGSVPTGSAPRQAAADG